MDLMHMHNVVPILPSAPECTVLLASAKAFSYQCSFPPHCFSFCADITFLEFLFFYFVSDKL